MSNGVPLQPPIVPMLGRLSRELPRGRYVYEPKWDGFRCLAFRDGDSVDLRSRNDRPLSRYFPEITEALASLGARSLVLDGELLVTAGGSFHFPALMSRLHPAARGVVRLRQETPALYVAFDVLAEGESDQRERPFAERRAALQRLMHSAEHAPLPDARNRQPSVDTSRCGVPRAYWCSAAMSVSPPSITKEAPVT